MGKTAKPVNTAGKPIIKPGLGFQCRIDLWCGLPHQPAGTATMKIMALPAISSPPINPPAEAGGKKPYGAGLKPCHKGQQQQRYMHKAKVNGL